MEQNILVIYKYKNENNPTKLPTNISYEEMIKELREDFEIQSTIPLKLTYNYNDTINVTIKNNKFIKKMVEFFQEKPLEDRYIYIEELPQQEVLSVIPPLENTSQAITNLATIIQPITTSTETNFTNKTISNNTTSSIPITSPSKIDTFTNLLNVLDEESFYEILDECSEYIRIFSKLFKKKPINNCVEDWLEDQTINLELFCDVISLVPSLKCYLPNILISLNINVLHDQSKTKKWKDYEDSLKRYPSIAFADGINKTAFIKSNLTIDDKTVFGDTVRRFINSEQYLQFKLNVLEMLLQVLNKFLQDRMKNCFYFVKLLAKNIIDKEDLKNTEVAKEILNISFIKGNRKESKEITDRANELNKKRKL
ncbi:hypothetical protein ABK040_014098 [Willaertia magna]